MTKLIPKLQAHTECFFVKDSVIAYSYVGEALAKTSPLNVNEWIPLNDFLVDPDDLAGVRQLYNGNQTQLRVSKLYIKVNQKIIEINVSEDSRFIPIKKDLPEEFLTPSYPLKSIFLYEVILRDDLFDPNPSRYAVHYAFPIQIGWTKNEGFVRLSVTDEAFSFSVNQAVLSSGFAKGPLLNRLATAKIIGYDLDIFVGEKKC